MSLQNTQTKFRKLPSFLSDACCHSERSRGIYGVQHLKCLDCARHDKREDAPHSATWSKLTSLTLGICIATPTHGPSQSKISTDAPTDNKGKGEAFSPTDLVATALATCMSTTMGIKAQELGVDLRGMTVSVQKEMSKDAPRRIVALPSEIHIPLPPDSPHREVLEQTALNCPVHKSLPPEIIARRNSSGKDDAVIILPCEPRARAAELRKCSMTTVKVRKAVESDIPSLLPLMRELAEFEKYAADFAVTEEVLRKQGFRHLPPDFHCLVAEQGGQLVGFCLLFCGVHLSSKAEPDHQGSSMWPNHIAADESANF